MKYRSRGIVTTAACCGVPWTPDDPRSCRQKTGCTKECHPKTLKCEECGMMCNSLHVFEDTDGDGRVQVCYECSEKYWDKIREQKQ
jgi:hypothetical protein